MTIDTDRFRTQLVEERERVKRALDHLHGEHPGSLEDETDELATASGNHMGDVASATLDREIDYSLGGNSEQLLGEIDAALKRIDDGTYGTCVKCGREIQVERLEARPWASLCIDDARDAERA
ncbi:MAG TPA: TraR/DksA C4-type zinc finger protein [Gaiellaceae bacterium]|nr:TraR/DksA C4-type zinc finger protein [Gaiellaceae bacterium]